jgi:hypothetical protein
VLSQAFYNDAINQGLDDEEGPEEFDLHEQYARWKRDRARSVISYSYVIEPAIKVKPNEKKEEQGKVFPPSLVCSN